MLFVNQYMYNYHNSFFFFFFKKKGQQQRKKEKPNYKDFPEPPKVIIYALT